MSPQSWGLRDRWNPIDTRLDRLSTMEDTSTALVVAGHRILLSQTLVQPAALFSDEWLASELWPAAVTLCSALEHNSRWRELIASAPLVVELGAGTGACGITAAALGARRVLLTDLPCAVPLLELNACAARTVLCMDRSDACRSAEALGSRASSTTAPSQPGACTLDAMPLCWRSDWDARVDECAAGPAELPRGARVVLASDCLNPVYGARHAADLAWTIAAILRRGEAGALALLAQTARGRCEAESIFFEACASAGLRGARVDAAATPGLVAEAGSGELEVALYELRLLEAAGCTPPAESL